jgi:hypothetical protein
MPRLEQWISSRQCYALLFLAAMMDELQCGGGDGGWRYV